MKDSSSEPRPGCKQPPSVAHTTPVLSRPEEASSRPAGRVAAYGDRPRPRHSEVVAFGTGRERDKRGCCPASTSVDTSRSMRQIDGLTNVYRVAFFPVARRLSHEWLVDGAGVVRPCADPGQTTTRGMWLGGEP
jgi:hypothetical protein